MIDEFYRAFEERYRGSRSLIKHRLRVYLPFVWPLKTIYADANAIDLGCGRGEWLELMGKVGISATGVDLDEGMLAACKERGLTGLQGDAIRYLRELPDASVAAVSAFHVAEHIPFEALQRLVQEALRVLKPAGLLILETPNPENLSVGAAKFYYDPTHERPIPPPLLSFLPEFYGFARTKVLRLQERPGLAEAEGAGLADVLLGVSPDYSVVAQKGSESPGDLARFDKAFATEFGVDLDTLIMKYDNEMSGKLAAVLERVDRSAEVDAWARTQLATRDAEIARLNEHVAWQQGQWEQARADLAAKDADLAAKDADLAAKDAELAAKDAELAARNAEILRLHGHIAGQQREWEQAKARSSEREKRLQMTIDALHGSTSWRITAPLRGFVLATRQIGRSASGAKLALKLRLKPHMVRAGAYISTRRTLKAILINGLKPFPSLHKRLKRAATNAPIISNSVGLATPLIFPHQLMSTIDGELRLAEHSDSNLIVID